MALLIITVLFAGGALYIKYKLENLRATVQAEVESRTGAQLHVDSVRVNGLRGLRLENVDISFQADAGPALTFVIPTCFIHINIADLLYGAITIDRIVADHSTIRLVRPPDGQWLAAGGFRLGDRESLLSTQSFRVTGANSNLEVVNIVGDSQFVVADFNFDLSRLEDSDDIAARFSGRLAQDAGKEAKMNLRYASLEDFDLRFECEEINPADVAVFLPASQKFIKSGTIAPSIRVAGYPNNTLVVAFETAFDDVVSHNQPEFLMPAKGVLSGVATYDSATHLLVLGAARAESNQLGGRIEGTVSFAEALPTLDLRLDVTHLPLTDVLDYSMTGRASDYGVLDIKLQEPYQLQLALKGTIGAPTVSVAGNISGGEFVFEPKQPDSPRGKLKLGMMTLAWNSLDAKPSGSFSVVDGTLSHSASKLTAEKVAGVLTLGEDRVTVSPFTAMIGGNPFVGSVKYDFSAQQLDVTAEGALPAVEDLVPKEALEGLVVKGPVNIRCNVVKTPAKTVLDADVDATQADMAYQWWFSKPPGIGAAFNKMHIELVTGKSLQFNGKTAIASSELDIEGKFTPADKKKWQPRHIKAASSKLEVDALGKCLIIPYKISGGAVSGVLVEWDRDAAPAPWKLTATATFDDLSLLAQGQETPMVFAGLQVVADIHDAPEAKGALTLTAKKAVLPPLRSKWFAPIELPPEVKKKYSITERAWSFDLAGETVQVDHWKGRDFKGAAYLRGNEAGLSAFRANLDGGGEVEGAYARLRDDNKGDLTFKWNGIQADYLIRQLGYEQILTGATSGEIRYSLDSDDPATLKGAGAAEISNGQLSADYIISKLEGRLQEHITSLPVSLKFTNFKTNIVLDGDLVTTSDLRLDSNGINVTGDGKFFLHGDMDYSLKVAISPDLAEKIPALRDNMNVQGLRLAQQNVELSFNVKGPIINPKAELAAVPPVAVTVVSSALEVTSDAMKVIDIPRKILVDLLKIGGGIVGMSK